VIAGSKQEVFSSRSPAATAPFFRNKIERKRLSPLALNSGRGCGREIFLAAHSPVADGALLLKKF